MFEAKERNVIHYSSTFLMKLFVFLILLEVAREQGWQLSSDKQVG